MRSKILSLFEYRKFPELFEMTNSDNNAFINDLVDLQLKIYYLDAHLESNWILDPKALAYCWKDIYETALLKPLSKEDKVKYCKQILKYQSHETRLRKQKLPTDFKLEYFYFYKSCDVKLLRRLIYERYPRLARFNNLTTWRWFDLITEINDDVEDVYEDLDCYNGNAFSIYMVKKGKEFTQKFFVHYINEVIAQSEETLLKSEHYLPIHNWTVENAHQTKELINKRIDEVDLEELKSSLLFIELS